MTTTIRNALIDIPEHASGEATPVDAILGYLGIDPATPAEWATVDHCLTWLRERDYVEIRWADDAKRLLIWGGWFRNGGPTLHAALITACQTIAEAQP